MNAKEIVSARIANAEANGFKPGTKIIYDERRATVISTARYPELNIQYDDNWKYEDVQAIYVSFLTPSDLEESRRDLGMAEILKRLTEWKENIDCDIRAFNWDSELVGDALRQSVTLAQAIGLLSTIGSNNNIHQ